jgi:type II secretory pathway component PulF
MNSLVNSLVLAGIGDYVQWWQWLLLGLLIVLIIVFVKIRNKQM